MSEIAQLQAKIDEIRTDLIRLERGIVFDNEAWHEERDAQLARLQIASDLFRRLNSVST